MFRGNLLKAALLGLALLLAPALFASTPCSSCFSTYIGVSESNGTIEASLFSLNQTMNVTQGMGYFDQQVAMFLNGSQILQGSTGYPTGGSPVSVEMSINPVENASLWFTYYDRQGQQQNVSGCYPVYTDRSRTITYIDTSLDPPRYVTTNFWYGNCTIPYSLYNGSSVTIYIEFRGGQVLQPTVHEIVIYDVNAGGLNAIAQALQNRAIFDPTRTECLAGMIMFGLLLASMYYSGKSPLAYMDISVPRIPKPKAIGYGSLIAGAGNIRLSMPSAWDQRYIDKLIARHAKYDFGGRLRRDVERQIDAMGGSPIRKYFAKAEAARGGDWRRVFEKNANREFNLDEKQLILEARQGMWKDVMRGREFPHQLLMVMDQRIANEKLQKGMGVVTGDQPKVVKAIINQVRKVPMIGTFIGIAAGSIFYSLRTGRLMTEAAASKPIRMAMQGTGTYGKLNVREKAGEDLKPKSGWLGWLNPKRKLFEVASMTDPKKMNLGKLFQVQDYSKRFYDDARDAYFDEISMNILWHEVVRQLRQKVGAEEAAKLIESQTKFKDMFMKKGRLPEFIHHLESMELPPEIVSIMRDYKLFPKERAERIMRAYEWWISSQGLRQDELRLHQEFMNQINGFSTRLTQIDAMPANDFEQQHVRTSKLVEMVRSEHHLDDVKVLDSVQNGKFFVLTGRNSFIHEENGERHNFGFLGLALKEYLDQQQYLGFMKERYSARKLKLPEGKEAAIAASYDQFAVADAFKLAFLKIGSHVIGHKTGPSAWFETDPADSVVSFDPITGKQARKSFVQEILSFKPEDTKYFFDLMNLYFKSFFTVQGLSLLGGKDDVTPFLFNVGMQEKKKEEETTPNPLKRQQWYTMQSESIPEPQNWRANMNFAWTSLPGMGFESSGKKATLFHEVRGEKFWANRPRMEDAWGLIETHMNTRLAHMLNGSQWDFASGSFTRPDTFTRFSRVDMYKFFNETWDYYSKANDALRQLYKKEGGDAKSFEEFLKKPVTYDMLRNSKMPFVYTHDYSYVPYIKGMVISDFDRVINGTFVLEDEKGKRTFNFNKFGKYYTEIDSNPIYHELAEELKALGRLRKQPPKEYVDSFEEIARSMGIDPAGIASMEQLLAKIAGLKISQDDKGKLLNAWQHVDPNLQPIRALTREEVEHTKNLLKNSDAPAEIKLTFLYQFSQTTHDWKSIWSDPEMNFFRLVSPKEWMGPSVGKFGELLGKVIGRSNVESLYGGLLKASYAVMNTVEPMMYASGKPQAEAMANNVAVSELYRERGHDMRVRIKSGGFLDDTGYEDYEKKVLDADYNAYANSFQRFFIGWMDSVTRDPRGSSTQWGRQWYLNTLYHRGGAMHPESHEFGGERTFLKPLTWFFAQTFQRANTLNWAFASPFVRMMRGFQTATYGYPTLWDKNIGPSGDIDLMEPWPHVEYTGAQKWRALLNPAESIFTLGKFRPAYMLARTIHATPGLNLIPYFFPSLDPTDNGGRWAESKSERLNKFLKSADKPLNEYKWFSALSHIPYIGSYLDGSQAQRSGRAGRELAYAQLKQVPEDFLQYKGGQYTPYITDTANPGVSYIDYMGQGKMAARNARYLVSDVTGGSAAQSEMWRNYYANDAYVQRQSSFSMARRGISAEAKRLQFQQEFTGYSPLDNPMWAPLSWPTAAYWGTKWLGESKLSIGVTSSVALAAGGPFGWSVPIAQAAYQTYRSIRKSANRSAESIQEDIAGGQMPNFAEAAATGRKKETMLQKAQTALKDRYAKFSNDVHTCMYCGVGHVTRGRLCPKCGRAGG